LDILYPVLGLVLNVHILVLLALLQAAQQYALVACLHTHRLLTPTGNVTFVILQTVLNAVQQTLTYAFSVLQTIKQLQVELLVFIMEFVLKAVLIVLSTHIVPYALQVMG